MKISGRRKLFIILNFLFLVALTAGAQPVKWAADGNSYFKIESGEANRYTLPGNTKSTFLSTADLTPAGQTKPLTLKAFYLSEDQQKVLIYTNSKRVWRQETQGDYWLLDRKTRTLRQIGTERAPSSLRFAKFSPDGNKVAYVSENNIYMEDLGSGRTVMLTPGGNKRMIHGTFDWAYEEEFGCQDGFLWSPDGTRIAFWQIDANKVRNYLMLNTTDSVYSRVVPVEYPTAGQNPSPARIGVVTVNSGKIAWLNIPGDPEQHYLPKLEWNGSELFVQQLNRKQNESKIFRCTPDGNCKMIYQEQNDAWIDVNSLDLQDLPGRRNPFNWMKNGEEFLWFGEKDGWRHLYSVTRDGKERLLTPGNFDVIDAAAIDEKNGLLYFMASPDNATQSYLYKIRLDGKGKMERLSPAAQNGTHSYVFSPNGKYASHSFTNSNTRRISETITMPDHKPLNEKESIQANLASVTEEKTVEFFKVKSEDGIEMDGWMVKPKHFDPNKKYPVVFYVYAEIGQTVTDRYGVNRSLYAGDMREDGYVYISVDNYGTPAPKGSTWRKSIYRKIGRHNIKYQAAAAKEILKWPFIDADRVAVWGWSGGGSTTLNLLFQYPEIYKTGIAVAAVANQLTYDNIYQERFMGIPQENIQDFIDGSPITYAKNLKGNLLYIHGTGDDNVHYNNAEMLINELVRYKKPFQLMAYPNRSHGIHEGEGTTEHLSMTFTDFLKKYCPPGGR